MKHANVWWKDSIETIALCWYRNEVMVASDVDSAVITNTK